MPISLHSVGMIYEPAIVLMSSSSSTAALMLAVSAVMLAALPVQGVIIAPSPQYSPFARIIFIRDSEFLI
jgi:hypothetical protein